MIWWCLFRVVVSKYYNKKTYNCITRHNGTMMMRRPLNSKKIKVLTSGILFLQTNAILKLNFLFFILNLWSWIISWICSLKFRWLKEAFSAVCDQEFQTWCKGMIILKLLDDTQKMEKFKVMTLWHDITQPWWYISLICISDEY